MSGQGRQYQGVVEDFLPPTGSFYLELACNTVVKGCLFPTSLMTTVPCSVDGAIALVRGPRVGRVQRTDGGV